MIFYLLRVSIFKAIAIVLWEPERAKMAAKRHSICIIGKLARPILTCFNSALRFPVLSQENSVRTLFLLLSKELANLGHFVAFCLLFRKLENDGFLQCALI